RNGTTSGCGGRTTGPFPDAAENLLPPEQKYAPPGRHLFSPNTRGAIFPGDFYRLPQISRVLGWRQLQLWLPVCHRFSGQVIIATMREFVKCVFPALSQEI